MKKINSYSRKRMDRVCQFFLVFSLSFILCSFESHQLEEHSTDQQMRQDSHSSENTKEEEISDWEARLELARVLSYLKRYDESLQEYHQLLQIQPDSMTARIEMAKVLFYQGKTEEALAEFSKIPYQKIDDATWIVIADIHRKKKNYQDAENIYFQYLKKKPQDDKVRLKLAELLSWQKRYAESVYQYQVILSHRPNDVQVRRRYAQVLTWMGQDEEAVEEWRKTLK